MAEFELKITGSLTELFSIASRLGGATVAPAVIAAEQQRAFEPVGSDTVQVVVPQPDTSAAALETASAPRKRRTKAEIAADEAAAKPSAFETPVTEPVAEAEPGPETAENPPVETTAPEQTSAPSQPTSDASPAATPGSVTEPTWQDCFDMMDFIVNKKKPPAPAAQVQKALKDATGGEIASLAVLKERPDLFGAAYAALAAFKD